MKRNDLEFYDVSAEHWWKIDAKIYALYHLNQPRFEFFDKYVSDWQGLEALDVGCGGGFSCEFMAKRGALVSGIDRSEKCIKAAQAHADSSKLKIDYRYGFAEKMPYPDNTFDIVTCVDVLEHVADVQKTLLEINRVLKPEGLLFFDTINRNFKSKLVMIWLMENILREIQSGIHDWNKFIKPEELTQLMYKTGFSDINIKGFDIFGDALKLNFVNYIDYKKNGSIKVKINDDTSIMYIGKAVKTIQ